MRVITVAALLIVTTACGGSPTPQPQGAASPTSQPEALGPPATLPGTTLADSGQIEPADPSKFNKTPGYSPYAGRKYPERVYFGDEHVHTAWSVDAGGSGTTLGPEEAVRFARGEEVVSTSGQPVKLRKPLDWIAITDHSDGMGVITEIKAGNAEMMQDTTIKRWHDMFARGGQDAKSAVMELVAAQATKKLPPLIMDPRFAKAVWDKNIAIQEKYNEPGRFTAFIAYEWTSNAGGGDNLHRNVIYRDGKAKAEQVLPMTTFQSENPEDLWKWMAAWEQKTGGKLLAIPHNGNLSNGRMFPLTTFAGRLRLATQRALPWAAISSLGPRAKRAPSWSAPSRIRSAATWIASKSSRAFWIRTARRKNTFMTWSGGMRPTAASSTASCNRWATRSTLPL